MKRAIKEGRNAIAELKRYNCKLNIESDKGIVVEKIFRDIFYPLNENTATDGVLSMSIEDTSTTGMGIVKLPKGGAIYHHFHRKLNEFVMVISGCINYIVYETNIRSKIIAEGKLAEGEKLHIPSGQTHYVFTSDMVSYLKIGFSKI